MSNQWGNREYAPDPPPTRPRRDRVPGTSDAQQAYAALAAISLTVASLLCFFDRLGAIDVGRGVYAIAIGLFAFGGHGWTVCRAETRVRRDLGGKVAELTTVLAELRTQVTQQRITYLPAPRRHGEGQRYIGAVAVERTAVDQDTIGLDPECIDAARRITAKLRAVDNE